MRLTLTVAAALLLTAPVVGQDDKVTLKWKFAKDAPVCYEVTQRSQVESDVLSWDMSSEFIFKGSVKDLSEKGEATIELTHDVVKFKITGFAETEYDSVKDKKAPDDPVGQAVAKMLGTSFVMKITTSGKVTSVTGFDKIQEKMLEVMGDGTEMAQGVVKQVFNDKSQQALLQQAFVQLPDEPVAVGGTWKSSYPMDMGMLGSFTFNNEGTFKGAKGTDATLENKTTVKSDDGGSMLELVEGSGKSEGTFDTAAGRLTASKMSVELKMKMGDGEFPVTLTSSLKLVK